MVSQVTVRVNSGVHLIYESRGTLAPALYNGVKKKRKLWLQTYHIPPPNRLLDLFST